MRQTRLDLTVPLNSKGTVHYKLTWSDSAPPDRRQIFNSNFSLLGVFWSDSCSFPFVNNNRGHRICRPHRGWINRNNQKTRANMGVVMVCQTELSANELWGNLTRCAVQCFISIHTFIRRQTYFFSKLPEIVKHFLSSLFFITMSD